MPSLLRLVSTEYMHIFQLFQRDFMETGRGASKRKGTGQGEARQGKLLDISPCFTMGAEGDIVYKRYLYFILLGRLVHQQMISRKKV